MGLKERLSHFVGRQMFERPAQKLTLEQHTERLVNSGAEIAGRIAGVQATDAQREKLRHVIGIERWSQRRLRVLLGEPPVQDGHHPYKPAADLGWAELVQDFAKTRTETVALAKQLAGADADARAEHNQFGGLSARGWLRYINGHAEFELKRVK